MTVTERVLSGRYRLVERLGAGGMGVVWRAEDLLLHREVAVKTVAGPGVTDNAAVRLEREARAAAGLSDNPHVVTVHDFGRDGDTLFIVMALASGRPLDRILAADGTPSLVRAVEWTRQVCIALEAAHERGIVHRDIKPANVMVAADGVVRVLDFGIAWFHPELGLDRLSQAGGVLGSAPWMSPEQARGGEVGPASDLYSVGCLIYQLLTGVPPFGDRDALAQIIAHTTEAPAPPSSRRTGLHAGLEQLVMELLAKSPENRPASAAETAARLGAVLFELGGQETTGRPVPSMPARPPAPAERAERRRERPVQRRTVLLGLFGVVSVSTVIAVPQFLPDSGGDGGKKGSTHSTLKPSWKLSLQPDARPGMVGPMVVVGSIDSEKHAVVHDPRTGKELWRVSQGADRLTPFADNTLYATDNAGGALKALDPRTGNTRWEYQPLGDQDVSGGTFPLPEPAAVFVGQGPYVSALHHANGEVQWRYDMPAAKRIVGGLGKASGAVLARVDFAGGPWIAIGEADGRQLWTWQWDGPGIRPYAGEAGDRLFFGSDGEDLLVLDSKTGRLVDTYKGLDGAKPVSEHKVLLDTVPPGGVEAWSATDGKRLWSVPDAIAPRVFGDTVVMVKYAPADKSSGTLAVDIRTGTQRWLYRDLFSPSQSGNVPVVVGDGDPLILRADVEGVGLVRVDVRTGHRGPIRLLPEKELLNVFHADSTAYAHCADRFPDVANQADKGPESRLYAFPLSAMT
ncbi:protein kinase [Streptomyces sp. NPDC001373]|uniref:serine/threonine-protein kinase n=1 Tax=Streptomyces sp. NPDC001373 TaxID=3364565 RepID=UPI0036B09917